MDANFKNLLTLLQKPVDKLHPGLVPALSHYLSALPIPSPSSLTATAIASPVWKDSNIQELFIAFRQAAHYKATSLLEQAPTGLSFSPGPSWQYRLWVRSVYSGARTGVPEARAAALGGLFLGLEEVKNRLDPGSAKSAVEDEFIIALADHFEGIEDTNSWQKEFQDYENHIWKASRNLLYIASDTLILISPTKLRVLELPNLVNLCLSNIHMVLFQESGLEDQNRAKVDNKAKKSEMVNPNQLPRISRLVSCCIEALSEQANASETIYTTLVRVTQSLESMAKRSERLWSFERSSIALDGDEEKLLSTFKSLLFMETMIFQAIVDILTYKKVHNSLSNSEMTANVIIALSHLAFISSQFGGLASQGEGSFPEYRRLFYTAMDIVAPIDLEAERLVQKLSTHLVQFRKQDMPIDHPTLLAKTAFYLSVVEQVVGQLSVQCLQMDVLPVCQVYIDNSTCRETFEASHSVMLALLSSQEVIADENKGAFITTVVPFYCTTLIKCSGDHQLNVGQLRLAFASLIKGASAIAQKDNGALAWFCIDQLLEKIGQLKDDPSRHEQRQRLFLSLISSMSSLSSTTSVFVKLLQELQRFLKIEEHNSDELLRATYEEILRGVGDAQRPIALRWWFANCGQGSLTNGYSVVNARSSL
ncbi:hypothetical protein CPB86DRAFT_816581 [Serendipita vermifera]|nr:hypothetical protein CPB86DRAFT_816581 [Serendipita vermifera]